jgi:protein-S-isoprenylcysteine O-methyltransferase Ste14
MIARLARWRVPLGFAAGAIAFWLARPDATSILMGSAIAMPGELLRIWAAGHLTRWREVTRSGPYQFLRHPLYAGSTLMGIGFAVAAARWTVAILVAVYLIVTYTAAIRFEARELGEQFGADYADYREGRATPASRRFSFRRAVQNREYRSAAGLAIAFGLLWLESRVR